MGPEVVHEGNVQRRHFPPLILAVEDIPVDPERPQHVAIPNFSVYSSDGWTVLDDRKVGLGCVSRSAMICATQLPISYFFKEKNKPSLIIVFPPGRTNAKTIGVEGTVGALAMIV